MKRIILQEVKLQPLQKVAPVLSPGGRSGWKTAAAVIAVLILCAGGQGSLYGEDVPAWSEEAPELTRFAELDYRNYLPEAEHGRATAQRLNSMGFDAYKAGRLLEAAELFRLSLEMNPEHAYAHYNYAAVLAIFARTIPEFQQNVLQLLRRHYEIPEKIDAYRYAILHHLRKSILLREERRQRMMEDPDFDSIRHFPGYKRLALGRNPTPRQVVQDCGTWYSIAAGAFMPKDRLRFAVDFRVDFDYDMDRYRIYPESEERVDKSFTGVYRVDGRRLIIFPDGSPEVIYGTISIELDEYGFLRERRIELEGLGPYGGVYHHWAQSIDA